MMKKADDLTLLPTHELLEKKKKLASIYIGIAIPMVIAIVVLVYLALKNKNYALIAVALGCSIMFVPGLAYMSELNKEIKKRGESNTVK